MTCTKFKGKEEKQGTTREIKKKKAETALREIEKVKNETTTREIEKAPNKLRLPQEDTYKRTYKGKHQANL